MVRTTLSKTSSNTIGLGLSQTLCMTTYKRLSSYNDLEDFKQDVRLSFAPVKHGGQAFSWTAGKLETNGVSIFISPSS
ncbi:hypothetical protein F2Q69_00014611 [Brassica cretica]|uniref:Uncharacterized protein n=1 Tax=Brassica cretica TaxID=69181 RepID=A0A8S9QNB5_BRACR|nr:hypothetical protein F2Q69_00014611 [Brassica cretica]